MNPTQFLLHSLTELNDNLPSIADAIRSGKEGYVAKIDRRGRSMGYAMFNVERWDVTRRVYYTAKFENNGLPPAWSHALDPIFDTST